MKALSIKQPWASLIVNGHKDIENRDWPTNFTGPVLIHAGKTFDDYWLMGTQLEKDRNRLSDWIIEQRGMAGKMPIWDNNYQKGGIVGIAEIVACTDRHNSPWFVGKYGFVLRNARPLPFTPLRGQLKFFDVPDEVIRHLNLEVATK